MSSLPRLTPGSTVRVHQAFRCCPYAGMVHAQLQDFVEQNGLKLTDGDADAHIVHSCGSDDAQAQLSFDALEQLRGTTSAVVLTGCLSRIDPKGVDAALAGFSASGRLGPPELDRLDELIDGVPWRDVQPSGRLSYTGNAVADGFHHVLASTGCLSTCRFCAIRRATGRPTSRPIEDILADVDRGLARGQHDVLVVSTDLSAWGVDRGQTVVDVVRALSEHPGELSLSAESFEPTLLLEHADALLPHLTNGRWAMLGIPIQSGSERVLRRMARSYDPAAVSAFIQRFKALAPDTVLRTDILFGFADETDEEFSESLRASRDFHLPSFNAYQPRPGTEPLQLGPEVLAERRDQAKSELLARMQSGLPGIPRWNRSPAGLPDSPFLQSAPPSPWSTHLGRLWIQRKAGRLAKLLAKPLEIGAGWSLSAATPGDDSVRLTLTRGSESAQVGLRPIGWPGNAAWTTDTLKIWVDGTPPSDLGNALDALVERLR